MMGNCVILVEQLKLFNANTAIIVIVFRVIFCFESYWELEKLLLPRNNHEFRAHSVTRR